MADPLRALVVDDEPVAREGLRAMLSDIPDIEVVGEAATGAEAVALLRKLGPDLLFLDVALPDLDGFEVLEREPPGAETSVVFVTAFDHHAVRAFEVSAVDYLVKPFGDERLRKAVDRVRERRREGRLRSLRNALALVMGAAARDALGAATADDAVGSDVVGSDAVGDAPAPAVAAERIVLTSGGARLVFDPDEIDWIEAAGDYVRVHARDRSRLADGVLGDLEELLASHGFVRIHRSTLVNLSRIRDVRPLGRGDREVRLRDGTRLRVARRRYDALAEALDLEE